MWIPAPDPPTPSFPPRPTDPTLRTPRTRARLVSLVATTITAALAGPAAAVDGVLEINQTAALVGGITPADAPGFPVTLAEPGHYRLTGPLVTDANTDAVLILGAGVTLDLNGFSISCDGIFDRACSQAAGGSARASTRRGPRACESRTAASAISPPAGSCSRARRASRSTASRSTTTASSAYGSKGARLAVSQG